MSTETNKAVGFTPGQLVYLTNGERAEYVSAVDSQHIVRPLVSERGYDDDESFYRSDVVEVDHIFAEEPVAVFSERIKELNGEEEAAQQRLDDLRSEVSEIEQDIARRAEAFARHRALDRLDDFIEGRITHVVLIKYNQPYVMPLMEALHKKDNYDRSLKLVTLFGDSKGDLRWHLDHYSDGSGGSTDYIFPFLSEDEARQHALKLCDEAISDWRNNVKYEPDPYWTTRVDYFKAVDFIRSCGLSVPEDIAAEIRTKNIANAERIRDNHAKNLAEAEKVLNEAKSTQP